jgi:hypothetical protein
MKGKNQMLAIVNSILAWEKEIEIRDQQTALRRGKPYPADHHNDAEDQPASKKPVAISTWPSRRPTQERTCVDCG